MDKPIEIDGRYGEGGGQILRTSLALASLLGRPFEIRHIRSGRKKPGLMPQHLMAVRAMASITSARLRGAEPGSEHMIFEPGQIRSGAYRFDVGTGGSTCLVLQTMLPALLFAGGPSRVVVTGGTHVPWSPCFHYVKEVFVPAIHEMGPDLVLEIERWGWYPKGGGRISAQIRPGKGLHGLERLSRGEIRELHLLSAVSNLPTSIGQRQREQVIMRLREEGLETSGAEVLSAPSTGAGTLVFLWVRFEAGIGGFTALGKKGKRAEEVADEAFTEFLQFRASDGTVDEHLADQLVPYMALAHGRSALRVQRMTPHLKTNMWVIERFLPVRFQIDEASRIVRVQGTGFAA